MKLISLDEAESPVTVAEFKTASGHDFAVDDAFLADQLSAATEMVEAGTRRAAVSRDMEFLVDGADFGAWWFPLAPVSEILSVEYLDAAETWRTIDAGSYALRTGHDEPRLKMASGFAWPERAEDSAVRVRAAVGYATSTKTPRRMRQAIILLVQEWYQTMRNTGEDSEQSRRYSSFSVKNLMRAVKYSRPKISE